MAVQEILIILGLILLLGVFLSALHNELFEWYLIGIAVVVAVPIVFILNISNIIVLILRLVLSLLKIIAGAVIKSAIFGVVLLVASFIILLTYFVPHIGDLAKDSRERVRGRLTHTGFAEQCQHTRRILIEVAVETQNPTPEFETEGQFQEELQRVKRAGKERLDEGELVISVSIGILLLVSQIIEPRILQADIWIVSVSLLVQFALLFLVISIIYRIHLIDVLSFDGTESFNSLEEMEAAVAYQEGISHIGIFQLFSFLIGFGLNISNADRETFKLVLGQYANGISLRKSLREGWVRKRR